MHQQQLSNDVSGSGSSQPAVKTSDMIELSVQSMVRDGSLTMADVVWYANDPDQHQCLITWEVFGGGIMGNLLTDTHEAQLSLWPDSKYHIQVTCKNKVNIFIAETFAFIFVVLSRRKAHCTL